MNLRRLCAALALAVTATLSASPAHAATTTAAPATTADPADPPGCVRYPLSDGGERIVCTQGIPAGATLNGTDRNDIIDISLNGIVRGTVNGLGGDDIIIVHQVLSGSVNGGDGDDEITVTGKGDQYGDENVRGNIDGGAGDDTISTGGVVRGTVSGGDGADVIETGTVAVNSTINGGAGNDTIRVTELDKSGRFDRSVVEGGDGDDTIVIESADGDVNGGKGNDSITVDRVEGGGYGHQLHIRGGEGDDTIRTGAFGGTETNTGSIDGGPGADVIEVPEIGQVNPATVQGGEGDDIIRGPGGTALVVGPHGTVDGGAGMNTCRIDNRVGGTVANCRA
ncbi:calcium-binding protein [Streptomyces sp. UNOB3_S3]|uniref:calcium-binding protein n=1 Tax=Streptomyces sp. UNOB3_S3 TaxID=2871682 RepID=UPI001E5CBAEA|nr:hypothetical protein [Streptomyces sp. UNOB3_S3]MCC3779511.1 hypothetical protein [Streptomyces sp. UNOB3_S3]